MALFLQRYWDDYIGAALPVNIPHGLKPGGLRLNPNEFGSDTIGWLTFSPPASPLATLAWYLAAILRAAFRSACSSNPHFRHTKRPLERRLLRAVCPQQLQA